MAAWGILVDFVLELLAGRLQLGDQPLHFEHVHVLVVGVGVDRSSQNWEKGNGSDYVSIVERPFSQNGDGYSF